MIAYIRNFSSILFEKFLCYNTAANLSCFGYHKWISDWFTLKSTLFRN